MTPVLAARASLLFQRSISHVLSNDHPPHVFSPVPILTATTMKATIYTALFMCRHCAKEALFLHYLIECPPRPHEIVTVSSHFIAGKTEA